MQQFEKCMFKGKGITIKNVLSVRITTKKCIISTYNYKEVFYLYV